MNSIFRNMPPVVKNLVILNLVMYGLTILAGMQGIHLSYILGGYVFNSPFFEPYQIVTHFFMHGGFFHLFLNMFPLVVFGSVLEQVWGPKRFFIFYVATAVGAFFLHQMVGYFEVEYIKNQLLASGLNQNDIFELNDRMRELRSSGRMLTSSFPLIQDYVTGISIPVVGASGAVYGVLVAFGMLFPNTRLMLLFPPIPIKAKWLVIIMLGIEFYYTFQSVPGDNIAHLAHIGGALIGFILVLFWRKSTPKYY